MENTKFELVKTELELVQQQIDKFDELSAKVKTWAATIWVAVGSWVIQTERKRILLLSMVIAFIFWVFDAVEKNYRMNYRARKVLIMEALRYFYQEAAWPENFISPDMPLHERKWHGVLDVIFKPHIALLYILLLVGSLVLYWV